MREILFKGKRKDNGEWVEGYVFDDDLIDSSKVFVGAIVIENNELTGTAFYEVIPETVGQYTGLTDKNGKKIFEGDVVNIEYNTIVYNAVIEYRGTSFYGSTFADLWELDNYYEIEVVGNIHDDHELLEEGVE